MAIAEPIKALSTSAKWLTFGAGSVGGVGMGLGAKALLPSVEGKRELERDGISTISDVQATATLAPMAFMGAAAVGAGIGKRTSTAGVSTSLLGAAALLASTGASAMVNADKDTADDYLRTIVLMGGTAAGGFAVGAMDEIPINRAKLIGLGLVGLAVGGMVIPTIGYIGETAGDIGNSIQHRGR